jgi:hypothetical protein
MPSQTSNPSNPAGSSAPSPAAATPQPGTQPAGGGAPSTPPTTNPPAPQTFSGTWFQEVDPQILIHWTLTQAPAPTSSSSTDPSSPSPTSQAQVRIYQLLFDAEFPKPPLQGPVVPFSVTNPNTGITPYLQGSFVLTPTNPPSLEVVNLRFPGFSPQSLVLYPAPPISLGSSVPSTPAAPAAGGGTPASGTGQAGTSQPAATGAPTGGNPAAS